MSLKRALFLVAFLILPVVFLFQPKTTIAQEHPRRANVTYTIQVGPNDTHVFSPTVQTVNVNDTVNWEWSSTLIPHSTTSGSCPGGICAPDGKWDSGIHTAPFNFQVQFTTPGTYTYYCAVHLSMMQGTIIVIGNVFLPLISK